MGEEELWNRGKINPESREREREMFNEVEREKPRNKSQRASEASFVDLLMIWGSILEAKSIQKSMKNQRNFEDDLKRLKIG